MIFLVLVGVVGVHLDRSLVVEQVVGVALVELELLLLLFEILDRMIVVGVLELLLLVVGVVVVVEVEVVVGQVVGCMFVVGVVVEQIVVVEVVEVEPVEVVDYKIVVEVVVE
jgi:hypothetical protein